MDVKPIFWHSRHKEVWDLIATGKASRKSEAMRILGYDGAVPPKNYCYACECGSKWNMDNPYLGKKCACPLKWEATTTTSHTPCLHLTDQCSEDMSYTGLYGVWDNLPPNDPMFRELAALIRDLPLDPAHAGMYEVL